MALASVHNKQAKILLVGDFPSTEDVRLGRPFTGYAGQELDTILADAELNRSHVSMTTVFDECPAGNDLNSWALARKDLRQHVNPVLPFKSIPCKKGVVHPKYLQRNLQRLYDEIRNMRPNVIIALGNSSVVALCDATGITKLRGALHFYTAPSENLLDAPQKIKVIPTYAPRMVLANYEWRPHVVADFIKARNESLHPGVQLLNRKLYVEPTIEEVEEWAELLCQQQYLAFDIETKAKQITCIGFAPNETEAYVIPFWDKTGNYWKDPAHEVRAYRAVRRICQSNAIKIAQNGLYDVTYLAAYGIAVRNFHHDTMLLHHALYPALPKGLDFLGSIYANERAWKRWRVRGGDTVDFKREE
jgi:uracil-DNA glycosylase